MLLALDKNIWVYTPEEIEVFEKENHEFAGELSAFQLGEVEYAPGVYGWIDDYF